MALFNIPHRNDIDIKEIIEKSKEEYKPKVSIKGKGNTLATKLAAIAETVKKNLGKEENDYLCITDDSDFIAYCQQAVKDGIIAIDTETDGLDSMKANLVGVCIYSPSQKPAYVPVGHISAITETKVSPQLSMDAIKNGMKLLKQIKCVFHNAYFDLIILYLSTGIMLNVYWDTLTASHVLNENESHSLKDLYVKYILDGKEEAQYFSNLFESIPFCYVPYNIGKLYAAKDPKMTYELMEFQRKYLTVGTDECNEYSLEDVAHLYYNDLLPMIPILVDMKLTGMEFDFKKAEELKEKYTTLRDEAIVKFNESLEPFKEDILNCRKSLPYPLNYNSSEQIRVLFYDIAKIGVVYHKEPKGTGKNVISAILSAEKFKGTPIRKCAECLSEVKAYDKALSSFIDKLTKDAMNHNGKIHSDLNLSSTDCIVGDSLIPTSEGYYTIKDIFCEGKQEVNIINRYGEYEKTSQSVAFNQCPTIKVSTYFGFEIEGTLNHPILNGDKAFIELQNIQDGDYVFVPLGYNLFPDSNILDESEAFNLGIQYAGIHKNKSYQLNMDFNLSIKTIASIPKEIYCSSRSAILSFIKGLTYDSRIANGNELLIYFYSKQDAVFVQSVLANIGILSGVHCLGQRIEKPYRVSVVGEEYNKFIYEIGAVYKYPNSVRQRVRGKRFYRVDGGVCIRIKSISYNIADVYDFKVPITHSFISNSIVSHNTGRLSSSNPG